MASPAGRHNNPDQPPKPTSSPPGGPASGLSISCPSPWRGEGGVGVESMKDGASPETPPLPDPSPSRGGGMSCALLKRRNPRDRPPQDQAVDVVSALVGVDRLEIVGVAHDV